MYLQLDIGVAHIRKILVGTVERSIDDSLWTAWEAIRKGDQARGSNVMVARDTSTRGPKRVISLS